MVVGRPLDGGGSAHMVNVLLEVSLKGIGRRLIVLDFEVAYSDIFAHTIPCNIMD
jgi:hypothetical protein